MRARKPIFPHVIEINCQAGHLMGCNVYLVYDRNEWILIDIGYDENVEEIVDLIRQLDFPLSQCKTIVATHADVDHIQGLAKAKQLLRTTVSAHPRAAGPLEAGDRLSVVLAGGGIKAGSVFGSSNATASEPEENAIGPEDLFYTIYNCLGIVADKELMAPGDRPIEIIDGGHVRKELLA